MLYTANKLFNKHNKLTICLYTFVLYIDIFFSMFEATITLHILKHIHVVDQNKITQYTRKR